MGRSIRIVLTAALLVWPFWAHAGDPTVVGTYPTAYPRRVGGLATNPLTDTVFASEAQCFLTFCNVGMSIRTGVSLQWVTPPLSYPVPNQLRVNCLTDDVIFAGSASLFAGLELGAFDATSGTWKTP